jgi:hypothetical protein
MGICGNYSLAKMSALLNKSSPENTVPTKESLVKNYRIPCLFGFLKLLARHVGEPHLTLPVTLKGESKRSSIQV